MIPLAAADRAASATGLPRIGLRDVLAVPVGQGRRELGAPLSAQERAA